MSARRHIRDRFNVKLDGWQAYLQAIRARLEADANGALDRLQASKRRLRDVLEQLEREVSETDILAARSRTNLREASALLRGALRTERPESASAYASQKRTILAAIAATEQRLNAIAVNPQRHDAARLNTLLERSMRAIMAIEADLEMAEVQLRVAPVSNGRAPDEETRLLAENLGFLAATISTARRMKGESANVLEPEIASGIERVKTLFAALSK